jgi:hypothetical protein
MAILMRTAMVKVVIEKRVAIDTKAPWSLAVTTG